MKPIICLSVSAFSSTGRQRTTRKYRTTIIAPLRKPSHARSLASQRSPKLSPSAIKSNILSRRRRRNGQRSEEGATARSSLLNRFFQLLNVSRSHSSVVQAGRDERASYPRSRESVQITSIAYASRSIDCACLSRRLNGAKPLHVRSRAAANSIQSHDDHSMRPSVRVHQQGRGALELGFAKIERQHQAGIF